MKAPWPSRLIWPWGITYGSILGMNIHLPAIWMFTRGFLGFDNHSHFNSRAISDVAHRKKLELELPAEEQELLLLQVVDKLVSLGQQSSELGPAAWCTSLP